MYYTYIIRCRDNSLYTGYTIDIKRRLREHTKGINSKYTRSRGFSKLEIYFVCESKSDAMKLEYKIKQKSRYQKLNIIENPERSTSLTFQNRNTAHLLFRIFPLYNLLCAHLFPDT